MESTRANFLNAQAWVQMSFVSSYPTCLPTCNCCAVIFALPELMAVMKQSGLATDCVTSIKNDFHYPDLYAVSSILIP